MDSRIKFEQWLGNPLRCKIDENGNYLESALQMMWEGWQACSEDTDELKQQRDELLSVLQEVRVDLLARAEFEDNDGPVMNISDGVLMRMDAAIDAAIAKEQK